MFKRVLVRVLLIAAIILSVAVLFLGLVAVMYIDTHIEKSIDENMFYSVGSDAQSKVYYYEYEDSGTRLVKNEIQGEVLFGGYRCIYKEYDEIPQDLKDAFVAIEDKRFYSHNGVDWLRTATAGVNYFLELKKSYGGSTITQQLIKNVTEEDAYSLHRKVQEIFWALDLESKLSKQEILTMYLNIINLSQGCYGVGAAAEYYFSKDVSELTLAECACIAAITNSPSYYDPIRNPENNKTRRNVILSEMYSQGYITAEKFEDAKNSETVLCVAQGDGTRINSWYVDMVINDVIADLCAEYGYSKSMANLVLYTGGLEIYTVMDKNVQDVLDAYYSDITKFTAANGAEMPQSAMIVIDSQTGDILGVAGAIGEKTGNRVQNFATDTVRPAGSVIKPLSVYAPALESGIITWSSVYDDTPVRFLGDNNTPAEKLTPWPQNANGVYRGLSNISYSISHSLNTVPIKLLDDIGLEKSFNFLRDKLHLSGLISRKTLADGSIITDMDYAALALGQFNYGVSVKDITAAYSIFANDGVYNYTRSYSKVLDAKGGVVLEKKYRGEVVLSEDNADLMTLLLEGVLRDGTATDITLKKHVQCAGKTGTTQNKYDNWYIGYTSHYIGGVWMGYEYPQSLSAYSGNKCNKIWDEVMTALHEKYIVSGDTSFDISSNIVKSEYCADSGKLMTVACHSDARGDRAEVGYFVKGTEPSEYCDRHVMVSYDAIDGGVAVGDCPSENVKRVGLIVVERSFPRQIYVTDAQYVWRDIGEDIAPYVADNLPFFNGLLPENTFCGISKGDVQYNRACKAHFNYFDWKYKKYQNKIRAYE